MKKAILYNCVTGASMPVHTTTEHPDSHYGIPVWVDDENVAYLQEGSEHMNPYYELRDVQSESHLAIAKKIKESGLTQVEVAKRMGITPPTLTAMCKGGNPTVSTLQRISDILGCDIKDLFE